MSKAPAGDYPYSTALAGDVLYVASAHADELVALSARDGSFFWTDPVRPEPLRVAMLRPAGRVGGLIPACRPGGA